MTKRERLELLILKIALASGDSDQFQNTLKRYREEITSLDPDDEETAEVYASEMIQGMEGVWQFADEPTASTIITTAKTMCQFDVNDRLKMEGINIMGSD